MRAEAVLKYFVFSSLVLLLCPNGPVPVSAAETFATIGTGGVTGVYYPVGGAICRLVNKERKTHRVHCTVAPTGASLFNVKAVRSGEFSMGIVQSDVQYYAANGKGIDQFIKAGPDRKLRALFSLQAEAFTLVARDDADIKKFEDLKGKRINLGSSGSGTRNTLELLMKEYKWSQKVFSLATDLKAAEMAGALCDNKIDAYVYVVGHPNASIREATTTCASHLVPVTGPEVTALMQKYPFYPEVEIPVGMYKDMPEAVKTFGPRATLVVNADLPEAVAYTVTKTVFSNLEEFKQLHPALAQLTPQNMLEGNSAPFHPGAIKYFKEAGLTR